MVLRGAPPTGPKAAEIAEVVSQCEQPQANLIIHEIMTGQPGSLQCVTEQPVCEQRAGKPLVG